MPRPLLLSLLAVPLLALGILAAHLFAAPIAATAPGSATSTPPATAPAASHPASAATGPSTTRPSQLPITNSQLPSAPTLVATRPANPTIKTLADLKALQSQIEAVAKKAIPATVAILMPGGEGSGVIVTKDGYVLTAGHVADTPGQFCYVVLSDGRRLRAKTLGIDANSDAGLVKITDPPPAGEKNGFPFVPVGKTASLQPGDWVLALGHPGGFQRDSDGNARPPVVRLGRVLLITAKAIATDCTIVMGDSGGPLFNLAGDVVAIHSRIGASTTANVHIPVDAFTANWDRFVRGDAWGSFLALGDRRGRGRGGRRPPPDNQTAPATRTIAALGVTASDDFDGASLPHVPAGSPAAAAGLQSGDIIIRLDGAPITSAQSLATALAGHKPRDQIKFTIRRGDPPVPLILSTTLTKGK